MTKTDQERLAQIRAQNMKWLALRPDAISWETTFLLRLLDKRPSPSVNKRKGE